MTDGNGTLLADVNVADTDAAVAFAKVKGVYPDINKDALTKEGSNLADHASVRDILGTTKKLRARKTSDLYSELKQYVDSKEKLARKTKPDEPRSMEYWPLIKVVRIFTKAKALEMGTVIVDLVWFFFSFM
jgi:hypothetical protein